MENYLIYIVFILEVTCIDSKLVVNVTFLNFTEKCNNKVNNDNCGRKTIYVYPTNKSRNIPGCIKDYHHNSCHPGDCVHETKNCSSSCPLQSTSCFNQSLVTDFDRLAEIKSTMIFHVSNPEENIIMMCQLVEPVTAKEIFLQNCPIYSLITCPIYTRLLNISTTDTLKRQHYIDFGNNNSIWVETMVIKYDNTTPQGILTSRVTPKNSFGGNTGTTHTPNALNNPTFTEYPNEQKHSNVYLMIVLSVCVPVPILIGILVVIICCKYNHTLCVRLTERPFKLNIKTPRAPVG